MPSRYLQSIHFFPIKGMQGISLSSTLLETDKLLKYDRVYALKPIASPNVDVSWRTKGNFRQLLNLPALAKIPLLRVTLDPLVLMIGNSDSELQAIKLSSVSDAAILCDYIMSVCNVPEAEQFTLWHLDDGGFTDTRHKWISICGTASADRVIKDTNITKNYQRFRINLWAKTQTAFEEFEWAGRRAQIGDAEIEFTDPVGRCGAINVCPDTGEITTEITGEHLPEMMRLLYSHSNLGMFAKVIKSGKISTNDKLILR